MKNKKWFAHTPLKAFGEVKLLKQWFRDSRCQVVPDTLKNRLRTGWHPETAMTTPVGARKRQKNSPLYVAFGEEKTLAEWSVDPRCTVARSTLNSRLNALGWDTERAIATPQGKDRRLNRKIERYEAFGESKSLDEWVVDSRCQVSKSALRKRIKELGWDVEKALSASPRTPLQAPSSHDSECLSNRDRLYYAHGEWKTLDAWFRDERCAVRKDVLERRVSQLPPPANARWGLGGIIPELND